MTRLTKAVFGVAMLIALTAFHPANAGLIPDYPVTGTVTDTTGNPLEGVRITDGSQNVWTDSSGDYAIREPILSSFVLSASKAGYQEQFKGGSPHIPCTGSVEQVPCTKPMDFVLKRTDE